VFVLEDGDLLFGELGEVGAHEEGTFHHGPKAEVGVLLLQGQVAVADFEHVGVVAAPEVGVVEEERIDV